MKKFWVSEGEIPDECTQERDRPNDLGWCASGRSGVLHTREPTTMLNQQKNKNTLVNIPADKKL